jgi:hypothetical protein
MRIIVIVLALLVCFDASANPTPAQQLNSEGIKAARMKDWETAREKFEQSYASDPQPGTLFNLANAQDKTQKFVAARASYNLYLQRSRPGEDDTFRKVAVEMLSKLETKVAMLSITSSYSRDIAIELDGHALDPAELASPIAVDPGEHTVTARNGTHVLETKSVMTTGGEQINTSLSPPKLPDPNTVKPAEPSAVVVAPHPNQPPPEPKPHGRSIFSSPWFWGATTIVVLGVAAGGYYEFTTRDPIRGTLGPGVISAP